MDTPLKIVVLDAGKANPGDLSWAGIKSIGKLIVYDYTALVGVRHWLRVVKSSQY